jgi:acyl-coenzyme A synthetase/AMP-(fatty) acid ligase
MSSVTGTMGRRRRCATRMPGGTGRPSPSPTWRAYSARFACVLRDLGVARGDRVATLLPKGPELVITTLALWRLGAVQMPLFTAFGPQAIAYRVSKSEARVILTDAGNRAKLDGMAQRGSTTRRAVL